jgi:hypothetical protein
MKWFTVPALLAAALVSAVVALPFLPAAKIRPDLFLLEARVTSTTAGAFQVYYEDGSGYREQLSGRAAVTVSATPLTLRLPLPPGTYRALRIDPLDRGGSVTLHGLRVLSPSGRELTRVPLTGLQASHQIAAISPREQAVQIVTVAGSDDPQLTLALAPPLVVSASWQDYVRGAFPTVAPIFAGFAALLFILDRAVRLRTALTARVSRLAARPGRALALTAAASVVASAYPVVFLGKSYVSPNLGTVLLYDAFPTLPGSTSAETTDVKLSDVGAIMWQHVPFSMMQRRALADGELPLWNRYNAAGVPLLAQGQSMFGDPLHLLVVAANGAAWAWDAKYLLAKWLFATGLAFCVLALTRNAAATTSPASSHTARPSLLAPLGSSLLIALAAPFIGFFLYRINHPAFFSVCYAPWPLFFLIQIAHSTTRRELALGCVGLFVANLGLMNSGTVKEAYMLLVCVNLAGGLVLLSSASRLTSSLSPLTSHLVKLAAVAWTAVLFALCTTPVWATFLQTLKNAYTGYNAVSAYQIQPTLLLGAFDEIFYRPLMAENRVFSPSLNFLLLLGLLYFLATLRHQFTHRGALAVAIASLVPLSLAFGLIPPHWIVTLPFLGNIAHLDNTFSCALIVLWSVLAGVGFATAAQRLGTREGRHDLLIAGLLLAALVFGWIAFRQAVHRPIFGPTFTVNQPGQSLTIHPFLWDYLISLLVAAVALGVLVHGAFVRRHCSSARGLLIALCVATLLWRHGLHATSMGFEEFTARPTARVDFHARSGAMVFARDAHARDPGRGFGFNGNFFPGWTGVYGLETVHGPDALVNPHLRELVGVSGVERLWDWRLYVDAPNISRARPFFDALNVRFYFDALSKHPALAEGLRFVHGSDLDVYESPTAWPRAFFTDRLDVYDEPTELVARFTHAGGRPLAAIQRPDLANQPRLASLVALGDAASRTAAPATAYRLTANTTSFHIRASAPGVIVLTDAFWKDDARAELNGQPVPVFRVNHAFQGVAVETPGDYAVTFHYWPRNFTRYLLLSATGFVLALSSLVFALRRPRAALAPSSPAPSLAPAA